MRIVGIPGATYRFKVTLVSVTAKYDSGALRAFVSNLVNWCERKRVVFKPHNDLQ